MVLLVVGYGILADVKERLGRSEWLCSRRSWLRVDESMLVDLPVMGSVFVIVMVIVDVVKAV